MSFRNVTRLSPNIGVILSQPSQWLNPIRLILRNCKLICLAKALLTRKVLIDQFQYEWFFILNKVL